MKGSKSILCATPRAGLGGLARTWGAAAAAFGLLVFGCAPYRPEPAAKPSMTPQALDAAAPSTSEASTPVWTLRSDGMSTSTVPGGLVSEARVSLQFGLHGGHGYVEVVRPVAEAPWPERPLVLAFEGEAPDARLEIKLVDSDGSIFGRTLPLPVKADGKRHVVLRRESTEYLWGGRDDQWSVLHELALAVAGMGTGYVHLTEIGWGDPGLEATVPPAGPMLDPHRDAAGVGFTERRAAAMIPEDPLILEWLKQAQDCSSPERALLPSMGGNDAHTFNNALVAMAFLLKGEKERAERILDFFAAATDRHNTDPKLQNFFLNGEARGFYQSVSLRAQNGLPAYHDVSHSDRWMGDMVWLLVAYTHYERLHGSGRYQEMARMLEDLLVSYYKEADIGGYLQHGWRKGDAYLHEGHGHHEGNIDAYAVFRLRGKHDLATRIRAWLDQTIRGASLPLDLYSWRVLAYGPESAHLLDQVESDLRYRKTLKIGDRDVVGFFSSAAPDVQNIWLDGTGHMACGYLSVGERERGCFYANQLDAMIRPREINGMTVHVLPYTAAHQGGYEWVELDQGFISVGAWYIYAKNGFNPLRLEQVAVE